MEKYIGQQFGNYRLTRLLGRGGFADVYLGEHIYLQRQAAIKILNNIKSSIDGHEQKSFMAEARTIAMLRHPNIVQIHDFAIENDTPYIVMDYAPGGTLAQRHFRGTQVPLSTIVYYIKQIALALQYAHDRYLIHRDVKPSNMLVGQDGEILLSDFGIATTVSRTRSNQSPQQIAGTAPYMAPEQWQGQPVPESDQYALGIVIYEWLAGIPPFSAQDSISLGAQHLSSPPSPLPTGIALSLVEAVIMRALAKDPADRFPSIQDFALALEQACTSQLQISLPLESKRYRENMESVQEPEMHQRGIAPLYKLEADQKQQENTRSLRPQTNLPPSLPTRLLNDFFISYNRANSEWAWWVAAHLQQAGYRVFLPPVDFREGFVFKNEMEKAFKQAKQMIVILSSQYLKALKSRRGGWSAFKREMVAKHDKLLTICVEDDKSLFEELAGTEYLDLAGARDEDARKMLFAYGLGHGIEELPSASLLQNYTLTQPKIVSTPIATPSAPTNGIEILFCYSHEDEEMRQELDIHLSVLKRQKVITGWYDGEISAGNLWEKEMKAHLNSAEIILLLISPDFIGSEYCYKVEMTRAMERHDAGIARVIPIILRPTLWERSPFGKLQALPTGGKAITTWSDCDEAFLDVVQGIQVVVDAFSMKMQS